MIRIARDRLIPECHPHRWFPAQPSRCMTMVHAMTHHDDDWIELTEALRRYDVAFGYMEPVLAGASLEILEINRSHNAYCEKRNERFRRAGSSGSLRFEGNGGGRWTAIPKRYFRTARSFTSDSLGGSIEPVTYSQTGTMERYALARRGGPGHETWTEVQVEPASFEDWLKSLLTETEAAEPTELEFQFWFEKRVKAWKSSSAFPTEKDDIAAAEARYPGIGRQRVRDIRRSNIAPDGWAKQGKRQPQNVTERR